jgi:ATP-dependent DNA helicase RecG
MITLENAKELLKDFESDRIERTTSIRGDKLGPAVCALANDFANNKLPGYILIGVKDDGTLAGMKCSDEDLQNIGAIRSNGNVLPQPSMVVSEVYKFPEGEIVVVEVKPSIYPPVRYDGRCWIRVGPRMAKASVEEERILIERRAAYAKTFDLVPALGSDISDLSVDHFKLSYLSLAIDEETLKENGRTVQEQMAALRFFDMKENCPTNGGILLFGSNPLFHIPGAFIQYIKFDSTDITSNVEFEKVFSGALISELSVLDDFIKNNIIKERPKRLENFQEKVLKNYSYWALREFVMNSIMHRSYESNSPIYIYEFTDRIEIINPGGLFGDVNPQNFPNASDYRNVVIAEAMKRLGYVNRFNYGVKRAIDELNKNGNGNPDFDFTLTTKFKVTVPINQEW